MKKFTVFLSTALLLCFVIFSSFACASGTEEKLTGIEKVSILQVPNTQKYRQDEQIEGVDFNDVLSVSAAGNEYESAQLMLTAKRDVSFYDIAVSDLKNGASVIGRENIEVLVEKYIYVPVPTNSAFPTGYYPDAIVPVDAIVKSGENKIVKGNNQGILIRIYVPSNTKKGIYTATVYLNIEGKIKEIALQLEVYDFNVPEEIHTKTAFNLWSASPEYSDMLAQGHYYSDLELYTKYYNELLKYRVTASEIPSYAGTDAQQYAEDLFNTLKDKRISAYNLPVLTVAVSRNGKTYRLLDVSAMENSLRAIIEKSLECGQDLLEKAYLYVPTLDEPDYDKYWAVIQSSLDFKDLKSKLAEEYDFSGLPKLQESLVNIPNLTTIIDLSKIDDLTGYVDTWVPIVHNWDDNEKKEFLQERVLAGDDIWWYTCISPTNPYPSYHIDDNLIGSRLLSWMQKANNVGGNLYWCTNLFVEQIGGIFSPRDVWEDPIAYPGAAGDGYLFYPGERYGIDGPIGTLRLESIRDGSEDYEYLYMLEELVNAAAKKYSVAVDLTEVVKVLYDSLFVNVVPIVDNEALQIARSELAQLIVTMRDEEISPLVTVDGYSAKNQFVTLSIYCGNGTKVSVNGNVLTAKAVSGDGEKYTVTLPLPEGRNFAEITFEKGDKTLTFEKYLGTRIQNITDFSEDNLIESLPKTADYVFVEKNTDLKFVTNGAESMKVTIKAKPNSTNIAEKMSVGFTSELVNLFNAPYVRFIEFDVYNASDRDFMIYVTTNLTGDLSGVNCIQGKWTHVKMSVPYDAANFTDGSNASFRNFQISTTVFKSGTDLVYYVDNLYFRMGAY